MTADFTLANLPFGVAGGRVHVAIGDDAVDLVAAAHLLDVAPALLRGPLNALAAGPWRAVRSQVRELLVTGSLDEHRVPAASLTMQLPVTIGDYVDGYAGLHHATNLGRIFRPDGEPLNPNWRHLPVMYHGRAGTVVVSGTDVVRPRGQVLVDGVPRFEPTARLDIELELGAIVAVGTDLFGYVLVNDWSARDIQAFEYQPLGPFLGKSFATSISPWVVTVDALAPHLVRALAQDPPPLPHLDDGDHLVPDLRFTIDLNGERISEVRLADALYWTPAQQLAHITSNGATTRPGDLVATGTISGPDAVTQAGSLIERGGDFLADGDTVVLRGWAGDGDTRVGFGTLTGTIVPAAP